MSAVQVHFETEVNPTEDLEKVKQAVENIFGTLKFETKQRKWGTLLVSNSAGHEALIKLYEILKREQIIAAARKVLRSATDESSVTFYLNKQVAYAGHISFSEETAESPLGPIKVQIRTNDPEKIVDWLAPRQKRRPPTSRSR
ncbi:MAG: RNA-binding domain-containing protein [Candidatus Bathyarchaeia archaeon]|jgi:hypothetical protein